MRARPRRTAVLLSLAVLAAATVGAAWLSLGYLPVRSASLGSFVWWEQTPGRAHELARSAAPGSIWPTFGASAARTRYVPSSLRPPFRLVYKVRGRSLIEMPPIVARGRAVFGTHDGLVIASKVSDGTPLWTSAVGHCIAASPTVHQGVVYVGWSGAAPCRRGKDERGGIVALSLATGRVLWRFSPGNVESSPVVVDGTLFFSAYRSRDASRVYALRLAPARRIRWSHPIESKVASAPAVIGRTLFVSAYDRSLYSFDAHTGRVRWRTSAFASDAEARILLGVRSLVRRRSWDEGGYYANPAIAYRRAFLGTIDGVFSAFDARTGAHRWSRRFDGAIYGSAALWEGKVYVGTTDGTFAAMSARSGRVLWKRDLGGTILGSPTVTNSRVWISTTDRETFVLDARTGAVEWTFPDGQYSPLVVAGRTAVLVGKGRLYGLVNAPCRPACRVAGPRTAG